MLKKMSSFSSFIICLLSLGCPVKGGLPAYRKPVYPDKSLKEIVVHGRYYPEDKNALKELQKELLLSDEECDDSFECINRLNVGETLEEALKNRFSGVGKESFGYSRYREYCYNETGEESKKPIFNKNLRTRLYDKEGNLLSEDFLRYDGPDDRKSQSIISYLPYHDEGYKIHVVQLKRKKEVILNDIRTPTQSRLRELSYIQNHITERSGWVYNEERECHIAAFD